MARALLHLQNWSADAAEDRKIHPESPTPLLSAVAATCPPDNIFNIQREMNSPAWSAHLASRLATIRLSGRSSSPAGREEIVLPRVSFSS